MRGGIENIHRNSGEFKMNKKQTNLNIASIASQILRDRRYGEQVKSVAASALSQTKDNKRK
jgi:hypothetical protein